jgi:hypothetical protein
MHATFVDIENEFSDIADEVAHLSRFLDRLTQSSPSAASQASWEAVHVCASATEKIYTGCERIMAQVAREVDDAPVAHSAGWHAALLRRMAHPFPGVRNAVISDECYRQMDRLRAFRHRERNTYGTNLDFDIVVERSREAVATFGVFHSNVRSFFTSGPGQERGVDELPTGK